MQTLMEMKLETLRNERAEMLNALKLAAKYIAKMVADDVQTAVPPAHALRLIENVIEKAETK